jgi:glutamyl-tRNA synthetase
MFGLFKIKKNKGNKKGSDAPSKNNEKVVTRIAPSPTGVLHIGTARAALFNYLFAKHNHGKFILRIEDTDKERSKKEYEGNIVDSLNWLGLQFDAFYRQSERTDIYKKYLDKIIKSGHAYISKEAGGERAEVIRFKNPNKEVIFEDMIRGEIKFDTTELGDFVIAKSLDEPLYHLAVVVDDYEMGITHVIRGEDGISNTPRQILIQEVIGANTPKYAHLPLVLGKDKKKLSKRHGATSLDEYKNQGYLKEAILNHLAMLGWNPGTDKEVFTMKELIEEFDIKKVQKGGAIFNPEKLDWFNKEHLKNIPEKTIVDKIESAAKEKFPNEKISTDLVKRIAPQIMERISTLNDIDKSITEGDLDYYFNEPDYDPRDLIWKEAKTEETISHLQFISSELEKIEKENEDSEKIKQALWNYADEQGRGNVLWPLRYCLTGKQKSPDPFTLISTLGKTKSIERITTAIERLNGIS